MIYKLLSWKVGGTHSGAADDTPLVEGRRERAPGEIVEGSVTVGVTVKISPAGSVTMQWSLDTTAALPALLQPGQLPCASSAWLVSTLHYTVTNNDIF